MRKGRPNYRLVKIHRNYSVEQVAGLFHVHKNTVRMWKKTGLNPIDLRRPALFHGAELAEFIRQRRQSRKRPCAPGEMFCVRCRAPRKPAGNIADYIPLTVTYGNLEGICAECNTMMYRRASLARLTQFRGELEITFTEPGRRVTELDVPTVDSDLEGGAKQWVDTTPKTNE